MHCKWNFRWRMGKLFVVSRCLFHSGKLADLRVAHHLLQRYILQDDRLQPRGCHAKELFVQLHVWRADWHFMVRTHCCTIKIHKKKKRNGRKKPQRKMARLCIRQKPVHQDYTRQNLPLQLQHLRQAGLFYVFHRTKKIFSFHLVYIGPPQFNLSHTSQLVTLHSSRLFGYSCPHEFDSLSLLFTMNLNEAGSNLFGFDVGIRHRALLLLLRSVGYLFVFLAVWCSIWLLLLLLNTHSVVFCLLSAVSIASSKHWTNSIMLNWKFYCTKRIVSELFD